MIQKAALCHETYSKEFLSCSSVGVNSFIISFRSTIKQYFLFAPILSFTFCRILGISCFRTLGGKITAKSISKPFMNLSSLSKKLRDRFSVTESDRAVLAAVLGHWCRLVTHIITGFSKISFKISKSASFFTENTCFFHVHYFMNLTHWT